MFEYLEKLRLFLSGKKTYLVAIAGIATALAAFANGQIDQTELVFAIFNALGLSTIRAGVSKVP